MWYVCVFVCGSCTYVYDVSLYIRGVCVWCVSLYVMGVCMCGV